MPADAPADTPIPFGGFAFRAANVASGATENFEVYVPMDSGLNGALKRNRLTGALDPVRARCRRATACGAKPADTGQAAEALLTGFGVDGECVDVGLHEGIHRRVNAAVAGEQ